METYLVGGAVRDELLGLAVKDRDWVVVGATPEQMLSRGFKQVGADFPVFLHPQTREEYALARTERKAGHGYHGFTVYSAPDVTLEDDLRRRDLTINAMARAEAGDLVDPFNGQADLESRLLRHVSDAFAEDPLRILRTARFAARFAPLGFTVAEDTRALMTQMVADDEVSHLVPERVWQEIQRALHENEPGTFFHVLHDCNALAVLIPELARAGILTRAINALRCVSAHSGDTDTRFAALLSPLSETQAKARARALKAPNDCHDLARLTSRLCRQLEEQADRAIAEDTVIDMLDDTDAWRRPDRFQKVLQVLLCTLPTHFHSTLTLLAAAEQAANGVDAKALLAQGFTGKALGEAIRQERRQRIATLIHQQQA